MSANNCCIFAGNITREPELKTTQNGTSFTNNAIAINSGYGDRKRTDFFNFTIWGTRAEKFCEYVNKGNRIAIECEAMQNEYKNRDGVTIKTVEFRVNDWEFMQSKSEQNESSTPKASEPVEETKPGDVPDADRSFLNIPDGVDDELPFS